MGETRLAATQPTVAATMAASGMARSHFRRKALRIFAGDGAEVASPPSAPSAGNLAISRDATNSGGVVDLASGIGFGSGSLGAVGVGANPGPVGDRHPSL